MKEYLDNIPVAFPSGIPPNLTLRKKDENGEKAFSFTGDLTFKGTDKDYLMAQLVNNVNALTNKVVYKLENTCCNPPQVYEFYITHESLEWCEGECDIKAAAVEKSNSNDQITCLKNTLIWDNYVGFQGMAHPRMSYCNELRPNWMHDALIIIGVATLTSILVLLPVLAGLILLFNTINIVIGLLNSLLPSSSQINTISVGGLTMINPNDLLNYYNLLIATLVGCGRKHPSPLVRDYAKNVCGKCGLTFSSSIYNNSSSQYYNSVYFHAPVHKGTLETDTTTYWVDQNKPILNGTKFFNKLKGIVNGEWEINNNILSFERRDFFVPKIPWLDLTTYIPDVGEVKICWQWANKTRYSYGYFEYIKDAVNWVGGEACDRWNDIVEWNNPYSPLQKDEFHPLIDFSPCRFRDDGIDRDVLSTYKNFPTIGPVIQKYDNVILMNSHTSYNPMLLVWDPGTGVANGKVDGGAVFFSGYPGVAVNQFYNYQYWFDANYPGNLYDQFWYIEDPRISGYQGKDFTAELTFDCALLNVMDLDGMVKTQYGDGKIDSIELDFNLSKMTIKGTV